MTAPSAVVASCEYVSGSGVCVTHTQATLLWILFSVGVVLVAFFVIAYLIVQRRLVRRRDSQDFDRDPPRG